jgi:hypothetical protein
LSWHRARLTETQVVGDVPARIQAQFEMFFVDAGAPRDMAMFSAILVGDRVELYFSPATAQQADGFLKLIDAEACEPPTADISLAAGHQDALERFRNGLL